MQCELADTISDPVARGYMVNYRRNAIGPMAIADVVAYAVGTDPDVDVNEIIIRPSRKR